jgi:hypothetical protein
MRHAQRKPTATPGAAPAAQLAASSHRPGRLSATPRWAQGRPPALQAQLTINQPGDRYEQEADHVAAQVMRMPEPGVQRKCAACEEEEGVQRKCAACEEEELVQRQPLEEEEEELQMKEAGPAPAPTPATAPPAVQSALRAPGRPLDAGTRAYMEPRFGADFSGVRVHTDAQAAESAQAINAQAYTVGRDVVFGAGQYAPGTGAGKQLIAHELAHVVQQQLGAGDGEVMRVEVEDCNKSDGHPKKDLLQRHSEAKKLLKKALDMTLKRDTRGDRLPAVKAALLKWFKIDLSKSPFIAARHLRHVEKALQTTLDGADDIGYECDSHGFFEVCKPDRMAVTLGNIHICPDWWKQSKDRQAIILIHEWGHKNGEGINRVQETYCWEKEFKNLPSSERIEMPDAYEGYVSELSLGKGSC